MNKIVTYDTLRLFAYSNDQICKKPIRGAVLDFMGLGGAGMFEEDTENGIFYGEHGIVYLIPYLDPWAWMNPQAVAQTDEILDVLFANYQLGPDTPIVSTGGSMGGLGALVYTAKAARTPVSCNANCPVCDLPFHYSERPDLPHTLYTAFYGMEGEISEILRISSPVDLVPQMPRIPYHIFHADADQAVNLEKHSQVFVERMRQAGHAITLDIAPGRGHCDLGEALQETYRRYVLEAISAAEAKA